MKIMIFDVPASTSGALTILEEYYKSAINSTNSNLQWIFVVGIPRFEETENVRVLRYPWIKKSWFHRIVFDWFIAPKLVMKYRPDEILSLENILVPFVSRKIKQTLYVHQSLPFVEYKFSFKDNKLYWTYQNIIGRLIINSIKKADEVIVQTNWMKRACSEKAKVNPDKIRVELPKINIEIRKFFTPNENALRTFFYPATANSYKNHEVIIQACEKMKELGVNDYHVVLTLTGRENDYASKLYEIVKRENLRIEFVGNLKREEVYEWYAKSVLIFPSYIETFGLPLLG